MLVPLHVDRQLLLIKLRAIECKIHAIEHAEILKATSPEEEEKRFRLGIDIQFYHLMHNLLDSATDYDTKIFDILYEGRDVRDRLFDLLMNSPQSAAMDTEAKRTADKYSTASFMNHVLSAIGEQPFELPYTPDTIYEVMDTIRREEPSQKS